MESIKAKKLLPYHRYLLYGAKQRYRGSLSNQVCSIACESDASVTETIPLDNHEKNAESLKDKLINSEISQECNIAGSHNFRKIIGNTEQNNVLVGNRTDFTEPDISGLCQVDIKQNISNEISDVLWSSLDGNHIDKSGLEYAMGSKEKCNQSFSGLGNDDQKTAQRNLKKGSVPKAGDPNFVSDYYSNSRLHYISTWGVEFRDFINSLIQTTELKTRKRSLEKTNFKQRVIMHIDMDSFFVSVALRTRPELREKPVAVCHAGRGNDTTAGEYFVCVSHAVIL